MKQILISILASCLLAVSAYGIQGQSLKDFSAYRDPSAVRAYAEALQKAHPARVKLHTLATSPGGLPITLIEIGSDLKQVPAVWVGANFEGFTPLATEGALFLAGLVLDSAQYSRQVKWYILPLPNPDAAAAFFARVKYERKVNDFPVNDDVDDQGNEDGSDDLNGDGVITLMRVEHPEGTHIVSAKEPRLMVKADPMKGERGKYKLYPEGLDNDGDGKYNEDGEGGINVGINFPHLFSTRDKSSGLWPGETPEVYGIMEFMFSHPDIAMAFTLGTSDYCLAPPKGGRRGGANLESIKVPVRYARPFGLDPEKTYSMDEIMEVIRSSMPGAGMEITPDMVAGMLGLGAAVNPLDEDLKFYTTFSEQYKEYLKKRGAAAERMAAAPDKEGSFELWAYYHLGIPSFAMNLFTPPKPVAEKPSGEAPSLQEVEKMTSEELAGLGEEKITAFLKANKVPERMTAARVIDMAKSGRFTPKQLVEMVKTLPATPVTGEPDEKEKALLAWCDTHPEARGFVSWAPFDHPKLGKAEIGGFAPYVAETPPPAMIDSLCRLQIPWLLQLTTKLPQIRFLSEEVTPLGAGVYKLDLYVENAGILPWPTAMGARNRQPAPVVILLEGKEVQFLEGFPRTPLGPLGGNQVKKLSWILKTDGKQEVTVTLDSPLFAKSMKTIKIGG